MVNILYREEGWHDDIMFCHSFDVLWSVFSWPTPCLCKSNLCSFHLVILFRRVVPCTCARGPNCGSAVVQPERCLCDMIGGDRSLVTTVAYSGRKPKETVKHKLQAEVWGGTHLISTITANSPYCTVQYSLYTVK